MWRRHQSSLGFISLQTEKINMRKGNFVPNFNVTCEHEPTLILHGGVDGGVVTAW